MFFVVVVVFRGQSGFLVVEWFEVLKLKKFQHGEPEGLVKPANLLRLV